MPASKSTRLIAILCLGTLEDIEREHILRVLDGVGGNRTKAAAILGIGAATLFRKLKTVEPR